MDESIVLINIWSKQDAKYEKKASFESAIRWDFFWSRMTVKPKQRKMDDKRNFPIIISKKLASMWVRET